MHPDTGTPSPGVPHLRVLVVEDYDDAADSLCVLLDLWGFHPRRAGTGREARAAFDAFEPHVALLDVHLPDADGVELAREFLARDPKPLVAVISGSATDRDQRWAAAAGVEHFFAKPADPDALYRLLASCRG